MEEWRYGEMTYLEAQEAAEGARARAAGKRGVEALGVEGARCAVDEGRDAVLNRLGLVLVQACLFEPLGMLLGVVKLEARLVKEQGGLKLAAPCAHQLGRRVDLSQERLDRAELRLADQVLLIDDEHVGELELVAQQLGDRPRIALARLPAAVHERVDRGKLLKDGRRVDYGDEVVEAGDGAQPETGGCILERLTGSNHWPSAVTRVVGYGQWLDLVRHTKVSATGRGSEMPDDSTMQ